MHISGKRLFKKGWSLKAGAKGHVIRVNFPYNLRCNKRCIASGMQGVKTSSLQRAMQQGYFAIASCKKSETILYFLKRCYMSITTIKEVLRRSNHSSPCLARNFKMLIDSGRVGNWEKNVNVCDTPSAAYRVFPSCFIFALQVLIKTAWYNNTLNRIITYGIKYGNNMSRWLKRETFYSVISFHFIYKKE